MDRITPSRRPEVAAAGTQRWRDLLFLHWEVDAKQLRPLVPSDLELDAFEGRTFVGLVAFAMLGVRPAWLPRLLALNFLETNVRTYVHYRGKDPAVFFFSLDAASRLAVTAARQMWGLPYFNADMHMAKDGERRLNYRLRRLDSRADGATLQVKYSAEQETTTSPPGSLEHFLFERYLLFAERRGRLLKGQVHHAPYPVAGASASYVEETLLRAAGVEVQAPPSLCHYSPGVDVEVFGPWDVSDPPEPNGAGK